MSLKHVDHMTENMKKAHCGICIMNYSPVRAVKPKTTKKKNLKQIKTGEQKNV